MRKQRSADVELEFRDLLFILLKSVCELTPHNHQYQIQFRLFRPNADLVKCERRTHHSRAAIEVKQSEVILYFHIPHITL